MFISAQISYYSLQDNFGMPVIQFLDQLKQIPTIEIQEGCMSTIITGDYKDVMNALQQCMHPFLEKYPSVFQISISNACLECKTKETI